MSSALNRRFHRRSPRRKSSFRPLLEHLEARRVLAATITVNSTADSSIRDTILTFREALQINNRTLSVASLTAAEQAQVSGTPSAADMDTIQFNIPVTDANHVYYQNDGVLGQITLANVATTTAASDGSIGDIDPDWAHSWYSIRPAGQLPSIFDPVIINGYSQTGATANTNAVGLGLNTVLRIELSGQSAGQVDGLLRLEDGDNTEIRGLAFNRALGAEIKIDFFATGTVVQGNYIGTDISGTRAFAFTNPGSVPGFLRSSGVYADGPGNTIGGATAAVRNLISGNNWPASVSIVSAVVLRGFNTPSTVQGNIIGADRTGTVALGNAGAGILIDSPNNTIGGATVAAGNVISGNSSGSINLGSLNAVDTLIQNNKLGTDPTGTQAVGGVNGITIVNTASDNQILENTIAFGLGVRMSDGSVGNLISRNSIFSNTGLGIDLENDGVTPNDVPPASDPPDQDTGSNQLQNYPTITSVTDLGPGTRIEGTLLSTPNSDFRLEFFASAERDESDTSVAEGQTYLGFVDVSSNGSDVASFSVDLPALPAGQDYVTATATDVTDAGSGPANNTSEFSLVATIGGASFVVTNTNDSGVGSLREAILNANSTAGTQAITFAIPADDPRHFYYLDDGVDGEVSLDHIAVTTEANDANIVGIDPDWAHSWFSILPTSDLPEILETIVIDGYSQSGSSVNTLPALEALNTVLKIELDGENVSDDGLKLGIMGFVGNDIVDASNSTIKGLAINRFGGDGIELNTLDGGNTVAGNYIGTDVSGSLDLGNDENGVFVSRESGSTIGGSTADARNLISGNELHGIKILSSPGTLVERDLIGTDAALTRALLNTGGGAVVVFGTAGGAGAAAFAAAANEAPSNGSSVFDDTVAGFIIGASAQLAIEEIEDDDESPDPQDVGVVVGASFMRGFSDIQGSPGSNDLAASSAIAQASGVEFLQIDLGGDGVTPNDAGDTDRWQNSPVLSSAATIGGATTVAGTLHSVANTTFRIEFFSQTFGPDFRAGEEFLGFINVTTNSQGNASYTFSSPELVPLGEFVTATATRLEAGTLDLIKTSEFSAGTEVTDTPPPSTAAKDILVLGSAAGSDTRTRVKVIDAKTGQVLKTFTPYGNSFHGGVRVAVADLNNDGVAEIITAPGAGRDGLVKVFDLAGVEKVDHRINAYPKTFTGGVFVAAGDVNGDGRVDIITTPGSGRAAEVKVWKNRIGIASSNPDPFANNPLQTFLAFGSTFTGGATVAAGDLTGDGKAEVIIGNGPGLSPTVRVFDTTTFTTTGLAPRLLEIKPFDTAKDRGGVFVAVGDVRNSATPEIIIGNGAGGRGRVEMYNADGSRFKSFTAYTDGSKNAPVHVTVKEIDNNDGALLEVVTSQGVSGSSKRRRAWQPDATMIDDVLETDADFKYGYFVA